MEELDNLYDNSYFKEDIIKKGEKMPNKIKTLLEKGNLLNNEWNDDNHLIKKINDCLDIENNIKNIFEINENIEKCNSKKLSIKFLPENEQNIELIENIKKFGEIFNVENEEIKFEFKPGNNYNISNNGLKATKTSKNGWNCVIIGDKEIPKDRVSKWKIKINKNKNASFGIDILIGIGPAIIKGNNPQDECWCILSGSERKVELRMKGKASDYNNHNEQLKEGDIIEVIVDRKLGNLSFAINGINFGIACSTIPKDDILYPTIVLYEQGQNIEIV